MLYVLLHASHSGLFRDVWCVMWWIIIYLLSDNVTHGRNVSLLNLNVGIVGVKFFYGTNKRNNK